MVVIEVPYRRAERNCPLSWDAAQGQCAQCLWWVPECDPITCSLHQGMEQLWTGQDPRSQEAPENLVKH